MLNSTMFVPTYTLSNWIKVYWFLRGSGSGHTFSKQFVLPDGCATIVIVLKGEMVLETYNNSLLKEGIHIIPPTLQSHYDLTSDDIFLIDIQLLPGVFYQLFKMPVGELEKRVYDFDDLSISFDNNLLEKINKLGNDKTLIISELNRFFTNLFEKKGFKATTLLENLTELYKDGNLEKFYYNQKLSHRQIQRKIKSMTGLSPKAISKMGRFYNILEDIKVDKKNISFTDIAQNNDYTDQSHFIKDFKSFIKVSPREFLLKQEEYLQYKAIDKMPHIIH